MAATMSDDNKTTTSDGTEGITLYRSRYGRVYANPHLAESDQPPKKEVA